MSRLNRFLKDAPLVFMFLLTSFAYGIGFALFGSTEAVGASSLFKAMTAVGEGIPELWGIVAIAVVVAFLLGVALNKKAVSSSASFTGFILWLFATIIYGLEANWLTMVSVGLTSLGFWAIMSTGLVQNQEDLPL